MSNKHPVSFSSNFAKYACNVNITDSHAWVILWNAAEGSFFGPWTLYLSFGTCHEVNIMQLCSFSIHK